MDKISSEKESYVLNYKFIDLLKLVVYSTIGIFIFFIPIRLDGHMKTTLYHLAHKIQLNATPFIEICTVIYISLGCIKQLLMSNKNKTILDNIYIYLKIFSIFIIINIFYGKGNTLLDEKTMFIMKDVILNMVTVLPLSAMFMPFIMEYGLLDIVESYFHKFMKKTFKLSGKTVLNIIMYLFTDYFCGYFMTNKLYKKGKIRTCEACMIVLNFSILSLPMMIYVCEELSLKRNLFMSIAMIILFISNIVLCRAYPLNKMSKSYYIKTEYKETVHRKDKFKNGIRKYLENKENKTIFLYVRKNFEEVLQLIITLLPNVVLVLYFGSFIINNNFIMEIISKIFYPVSSLFKVQDYNQLNYFIVNVFYNDVMAVDMVYKNINNVTKMLMGLIVSLKCIGISTSMVYIQSSIIPISIKEFVICYFERIVIITALYFAIYYFYIGYV